MLHLPTTGTHTYAVLEVERSTFADVRQRLRAAGYEHAFDRDVIDMHGIALRAETGSAATLKPYQQRVHDERESLQEKVEKLACFLNSPTCTDLDNAERQRLDKQLHLMREYAGVLLERIKAF